MISIISDNNAISIIRFAVASAIVIIFTIIKDIHIIQLNSYNFDQQLIWYKKNKSRLLFNIILLLSAVLFYIFNISIFLMLVIISMLGVLIENFPRKQKKKLVYTSRIKRLIIICIILFIPFFIPAILFKNVSFTFFMVLAVSLSHLIIFFAYFLSLPLENAFRRKFMGEAKTIIDNNKNLKVVGITGSFGKTSVKYYLDSLLSIKYNVCKTPESFNTSMGATLTIKNDLRSFDDVFICEMGARRVGDIKEICDIVSPCSCILTEVGNMHLDTFKTIENVRKCKFELVDSVCDSKADKKIVLVNGDNPLITDRINEYKNTGKFSDTLVYTYGFNATCDFNISDVNVDSSGSTFTLKHIDRCMSFKSRLLGKHNILNLSAAISFALLMGVSEDDIISEVKNIEAVEHRLKLTKLDNENILIDDAYNANPNGARISSDVLASFTDYVKIMITPGMVELGEKQNIENEEFAKYAVSNIDYAFVVGKTNKEALMRGFSELKDNAIAFDKVEDAFYYARLNIKGKKVILLENDLSDNY